MIGLILAIVGAAAAASAIVLVISGIITKPKLEETLSVEDKGGGWIIEKVNNCDNVVTVSQLFGDETLEIKGEGIGYDVKEGDVIHVNQW